MKDLLTFNEERFLDGTDKAEAIEGPVFKLEPAPETKKVQLINGQLYYVDRFNT